MIQWMESFIPESADLKGDEIFRAKVLVMSLFFLGCFGMVFCWLYFYLGNPVAGTAILLEATFVWVLPYYFRKHGDLARSTHIFAISFVIMMSLIMISSGGASFSATPWWAIIPVFVILVSGRDAGKTWSWIVLGTLSAAYFGELLGIFPFENMNLLNQEYVGLLKFLDWFHYIGCILMLLIVSFVFDYINHKAFKRAANALEDAEEARALAQKQNTYLDVSVERILKEMSRLANGDLTTHLTKEKEDEIGRLCDGFNTAVSNVNQVLSELNDAVAITIDSSEHIADSTNQLATGTEEQAAMVSEITQSVTFMVNSIRDNANNATNSSAAAKNNGEIAREGGQIVNQTVEKIEEIAHVVDQSAKSIEALANSSSEIGEIVSVIQNIANKTNLLALNASIEAAHAGAAGLGFGVIAGEVKDLASQTAQATEKISKMILNIQEETTDVINDMASGSQKVHEGKELAGQAGMALHEIVSSSENVIDLVAQIADACEQQSEESRLFLERIEFMQKVSEESANDIGDIADSTKQLESLTENLRGLVNRFIISDTAAS